MASDPKFVERARAAHRRYMANNRERMRVYDRNRRKCITDLLVVLKQEMPDLLKEFGL